MDTEGQPPVEIQGQPVVEIEKVDAAAQTETPVQFDGSSYATGPVFNNCTVHFYNYK